MTAEATTAPSRVRDRAQYGLCAALALVGLVVIWDATRIGAATSSNDPVGPRALPFVIGAALLVVSALYALDVSRGGVGEQEAGEDVELGHPADWKTVGMLAGAFLLNAVLMEPLGWVISGALLFALAAFALGNRHHVRGLAIGVALSLITFYAFAIGLGRQPAGRHPPGNPLMDNISALLGGFADVITPMNLLIALLGVIVGTAVGVLPGIGPAMTVALLLPLTYGLPVEQSLILFGGIFYGGMYGGSTTSILLNTPGESASVVTALEGNKMAKTGRAAQALATSAIGSFVAGTIGTMLIVLVMPQVVDFAITLGSPEFLAIILVAFVGTAAILGSSRVRGFAALLMGITLGLVGTDFVTGQQRLTFGSPFLADNIDVVVIAVGIFAVGEALWVAAHLRRRAATVIPVGRPWLSRADWGRSWKPWLRGTALGFPFGAIPAGGAEIPTFMSYLTERRLSKHPEEFGKGAIEGVAGPEAANNASAAGTMVPLLALGLPTNATAAIIIAAFMSYGIEPGPLLLTKQPDLVWMLIASLFIGNFFLLVLNLPLAPTWAKLLRIPRPYLYAGILFFASMGAYAVQGQPFDLYLLLALGFIGFAMRRFGLPVLPLIVGAILGPLFERHLRRSLQTSGGDISGLVGGPVALVCYFIILGVLVWPLVARLRRGARGGDDDAGDGDDDGTPAAPAATTGPSTSEGSSS